MYSERQPFPGEEVDMLFIRLGSKIQVPTLEDNVSKRLNEINPTGIGAHNTIIHNRMLMAGYLDYLGDRFYYPNQKVLEQLCKQYENV